jgi:hypothetical protein
MASTVIAVRELYTTINSSGVTSLTHTTGHEIDTDERDLVKVLNTTDASALGTGAVVVAGGASVGKTVRIGTALYLPTTGGTVTPFDYYEEWTSAALPMSGAVVTTAAMTVRIVRTGKSVTLTWVGLKNGTSASTTGTYTSVATTAVAYFQLTNGTVPQRFCPVKNYYGNYFATVSTSPTTPIPSVVTVFPTGLISFRNNVSTWSTGLFVSIYSMCIKYNLY